MYSINIDSNSFAHYYINVWDNYSLDTIVYLKVSKDTEFRVLSDIIYSIVDGFDIKNRLIHGFGSVGISLAHEIIQTRLNLGYKDPASIHEYE